MKAITKSSNRPRNGQGAMEMPHKAATAPVSTRATAPPAKKRYYIMHRETKEEHTVEAQSARSLREFYGWAAGDCEVRELQ